MTKKTLKAKNATSKKTVKKTVSKKTTSKKTPCVELPAPTTSLRALLFKTNISKLDMNVHRRTHDTLFGTVTLKKSAAQNRGKRLFSLSSKVIHSGTYTFKTLVAAIDSYVNAK